MKIVIRLFFKVVRRFLEPLLLLGDWLTTPKGIERNADDQAQVDERTASLSLYQFKTCPFCVKVRRQMKRQSLNITLHDAQKDEQSRNELLEGGGAVKVPCLRIAGPAGEVSWMYESDDIIAYLKKHFE